MQNGDDDDNNNNNNNNNKSDKTRDVGRKQTEVFE
jgi:hypothetical protein